MDITEIHYYDLTYDLWQQAVAEIKQLRANAEAKVVAPEGPTWGFATDVPNPRQRLNTPNPFNPTEDT